MDCPVAPKSAGSPLRLGFGGRHPTPQRGRHRDAAREGCPRLRVGRHGEGSRMARWGGPWGKPRGNHGFLGRNLESIAVAKYTGGK